MSGLRIRRVRGYHRAAYPSRRAGSAPRGAAARLAAAAAGPAVALGLGAAGTACDSGVALVGEPDGTDADVEAMDDAPNPPEEMLGGAVPMGYHYTAYLTEAEGRTVLEGTFRAFAAEQPLCSAADRRAYPDAPVELEGVRGNLDLGADPLGLPDDPPPCGGRTYPKFGLEFQTTEAGDDEDTSANPAGFSDAEEAALADARAHGRAAVGLFPAEAYPYEIWVYEYDGGTDASDRLNAEAALREDVRALLAELKGEGLI